MEPFTLDRNFRKQDIVDGFSSCIWTERYYGDSEVELVVPPESDLMAKLPVGTFLGVDGSDEIMILETVVPEEYKITGISLLSWLNNRFIRISALHEDRYWYISDLPAGQVLWTIIQAMCVAGSPYLDGTIPIGIDTPERLVIPGLALKSYDISGDNISVGVPFGPVYDAMKQIATTYQVGMQITLDEVTDTSYILGFRSYRGLDRSSGQTDNPVIRFSPWLDSFMNIKELQSIAALKTLVYAFAPENPDGLATVPGVSTLPGSEGYTGFDLRALLVFAEDITTDMVGGDPANLVSVLNSRAHDAIIANHVIATVDGEIVPQSLFKYGVHYNLGDIIEVQGNTGVIQPARITEYIRAQDSGIEKAYPTLATLNQ